MTREDEACGLTTCWGKGGVGSMGRLLLPIERLDRRFHMDQVVSVI